MLTSNKRAKYHRSSCGNKSFRLLLWTSLRDSEFDNPSLPSDSLTETGHLCRLTTLPSRHTINSTLASVRVRSDRRLPVPSHHRTC
jgi:hypothetical protein